jgi:hypothetical protein
LELAAEDAMKHLRNFLLWIHCAIFTILRPFLVWASGKHLLFTHKAVTGKDYYRLYKTLKPGTVFVTRTRGELTSLIIPGYWNHAAIYAPNPGATIDEIVIEAEGPGVIETDLVSFLTSKDEVMVLEPNIPPDVMWRAAQIARSKVGAEYDFMMGSGDKAFYCSRLVWWSIDQACKEVGIENPYAEFIILGEETISPDNIAHAAKQHIAYRTGITPPPFHSLNVDKEVGQR